MVAKVREQAQFRQIGSDPKTSLFIAPVQANHTDSMRHLAANDLRPLTYQEVFLLPSELISELKGKMFHLQGTGMDSDGISIFTFNNKGELCSLVGGEPDDRKVRVYPGGNPLLMSIYSNENATHAGKRFILYGSIGPLYKSGGPRRS